MLEVKDIAKSYARKSVLDGVSFSLAPGEKVSIIGPGACGKSTILKIILGIIPPDAGHVDLLGVDMVHASEEEKQQILRKVGVAFQQGALFDYMTVEENLKFAMENMTDFSPRKMDDVVHKLLASVKLPRVRHMFPYELSGGMQRRVGLARALATHPQLAIFDEPTAGLDPVTSTIILNMINNLVDLKEERSMIVVTSSVEIAIRFAKRVILVHDGRVVGDGPWQQLLLDGSDWVRYFLGVRLKGIDVDYARELELPEPFIREFVHPAGAS